MLENLTQLEPKCTVLAQVAQIRNGVPSLLPPLRRARIASGGDADVAAACQTLGGISLHSESGKQPEEQPERG